MFLVWFNFFRNIGLLKFISKKLLSYGDMGFLKFNTIIFIKKTIK